MTGNSSRWILKMMAINIPMICFRIGKQMKLLNLLNTQANPLKNGVGLTAYHRRHFHLSQHRNDLMEFFDDPKNWGADLVKVGRAWKKEELRIKSNTDLHKLWYVLLKERNMLLTMEAACKAECELFPNPERFDKVEESMENLEEVVRERNKAYYELETCEKGEAPSVDLITPFGKLLNHEIKEYPIPKHMNEEWKKNQVAISYEELTGFNKLLREKINTIKKRKLRRDHNHVRMLLKRFPDTDEEAIKEQYPDVDLELIKKELSLYY